MRFKRLHDEAPESENEGDLFILKNFPAEPGNVLHRVELCSYGELKRLVMMEVNSETEEHWSLLTEIKKELDLHPPWNDHLNSEWRKVDEKELMAYL